MGPVVSHMSRRRRNTFLLVVCAVWLVAAVAGLAAMHRYESTAGLSAPSPRQWPTPGDIALDAHRHTLVMFVHPKCPCSAASIEQLDRIVALCGERVSIYVMAVMPEGGAAEGFDHTRTLAAAVAIPGVRLITDRGGREAVRFGAETSGHVLLYGPDGALEFSGGITAARGHAGDNAACDAVVATINGTTPPPVIGLERRSAVFGCSLSDAPKGGE